MKRRKKSKKRPSKFQFPHELTIYSCSSKEDEQIITDAGFERIDYQLGLQYFSLHEIIDYWERNLDFSEIEAEQEIEKFEELVSTNYYSLNKAKSQEFVQHLIEQFSWLPNQLDVATARAVYSLEHRWVKDYSAVKRRSLL